MNDEENPIPEDGYILICPSVSIFSTQREINEWIAELKTMPQRPEVLEAIKHTENLLKIVRLEK